MRRIVSPAAILIVLFGVSIFAASHFPANSGTASVLGTEVGGIIWDNTTWTVTNSPYTITSTIQIAYNATLTIQPGVVVNRLTGGPMFVVGGKIIAQGSASEMITFDGGGIADFFDMRNVQSATTLDLDYCKIKNGNIFWISDTQYQWASFNMSYSEVENIATSSNMRTFLSTGHKIYIQFNKFINSACFIIGNDPEVPLYITNNLFTQNGHGPALGLFYLYDDTVIENNSFVNINGIAVRLFATSGTDENISSNYWGTTNTSVIDSMIYDGYDDIRISGHLLYQPILTEPNPDTPIIPEFPSSLILPLFIIATLLAVIVYRRRQSRAKPSSSFSWSPKAPQKTNHPLSNHKFCTPFLLARQAIL